MKKPRVEDFDPHTVPSLGSPLDGLPAIEKPGPPAAAFPRAALPPEQQPSGPSTSLPTPIPPPARTPGRRTITRYAFEFFQDQIETLRGYSLEEKFQGEKGSMSEMVREAVDLYIAKRNRMKGG